MRSGRDIVRRVIMRRAKEITARLACSVGVPAASRRRLRGQLAILMFHGIEAAPLSPPCWHVLDAATFRRELEYVRGRFNVLPLEEALDRLYSDSLPDRAVALTFDDGTRNLATQAAPILRRLALPAAIFLATGPMGTTHTLWPDRIWSAFAHTNIPQVDLTAFGLGTFALGSAVERGRAYERAVHWLKGLPDERRIVACDSLAATLMPGGESADPGPFELLSWNEARALANGGDLTLYPHSVSHPILAQCADEKVEREIVESCAALQRATGCFPRVFAYPNGRSQDFDERSKEALRRQGVPWALSTVEGLACADSDPLSLPRIGIGSDLSFARFRLLVSGVGSERVRGHDRRTAVEP